MKKINFIHTLQVTGVSLCFLLLMNSCEKLLNPKPADAITSEDAINNANGVEKAIIGSYSALQYSSYYGRNYVVIGDIATTNLVWTGTSPDYNQINNNTILADNLIVRDMWYTLYDAINRVNNVIAKLPEIGDMSAAGKDNAYGECYFLRGLHHFNLVRLWGAVPIKLEPTSGNLDDLQVPRDDAEAVYARVVIDLSNAFSLLPVSNATGRATKAAAAALLAKVYLTRYNTFKNPADLDSSLSYTNSILADPAFVLENDYNLLFTPDANKESIFEITFNPQDNNTFAVYYFTKFLAGRYEFAPSDTLINSYEPGDLRKDISIHYDSLGFPYGYKYRDMTTGTDRVYVFRLAEMYLLRAEATIYKTGAVAEIQADINAIRHRAGLGDTPAADYSSLLLAVENERQHEFAFEGQRWFDLVRTDRAIQVLPNVTSKNQYLFPIPQAELQANTNPGMYQNPGY